MISSQGQAVVAIFLAIGLSLPARGASVCSSISGALTPSGFAFSNDRTHLRIPMETSPAPYFRQPILNPPGNLIQRKWGWTPTPVVQLGNAISTKVTLPGPGDFRDALEIGHVYTYVLTHSYLIIGRIPKAHRERFSKHIVLSNRQGVLMAGELWINEDGSLSVSNASGSYTPPVWRLEAFISVLHDHFRISNVQAYSMNNKGEYIRHD